MPRSCEQRPLVLVDVIVEEVEAANQPDSSSTPDPDVWAAEDQAEERKGRNLRARRFLA